MSDSQADFGKNKANSSYFMLAVLFVSAVAALVGWLLGSHLATREEREEKPVVPTTKAEKEKPHDRSLASLPSVVKLPTLLVNLASPPAKRIRLDVSLVVKEGEKLSSEMSADITSDFLLFLRTATLEQLKGASGIFYLRQDLLDRARIRSNGKVSAILLTSLILE